MNKHILKKIIDKLSFNDLYEAIQSDDKVIMDLGKALMTKKPVLFCNLIKVFITESIKENNIEILSFFKKEIIEADGNDFSINDAAKKVSVKKPVKQIEEDPCSRSVGSSGYSRMIPC